MNLIDILKDQVTGAMAGQAASFLGESESGVSAALDGIFPALLGKTIDMSESKDGLDSIFDLVKNADTGLLDNIGDIFGSSNDVTDLMSGGGNILSLLLGNNLGSIVEAIAKMAGLKGGSSSSLIKLAAPFLMSMIGKYVKNKALDAVGLGKLLGSQKSHVQKSMPAGLGGLLGLSGFSDSKDSIIDKVVDAGEDMVETAGDAVEAGVKTGGSMLKWLLPLFLLLLLASYFGFRTGCGAVDGTVDATKDGVETVAEGAVDVAEGTADAIGNAAGSAIEGISNIFGQIDEAAKATLSEISFAAGSAGDQIMKFIDGGFNGDGRFSFNDLTFETGSATMTADSRVEVDNVAAILKAYPAVKISVDGYTDNTGDAAKNVLLSQARAEAVKARLMVEGIGPDRITTKGWGSANPVATNDTPEGRAQNRRIELSVVR